MNNVNWSTQHNHVKTSLPDRLIRMRYIGALALEDFRDLQLASEKAVKVIKQKDFHKYLTVANPRNGEEFFNQINLHYSASSKPETIIEKLQKVAIAQVEPEYKAKWLQWWNSGYMRWAAYRFLLVGFKEAKLDLWLKKATFLAHLEYRVVKEFNEISGGDLGDIDWTASNGIMKPNEYVESFRILL